MYFQAQVFELGQDVRVDLLVALGPFSGGRAVGVGEFQIRAAQDEFVEDGPIGECAAGGILLTGGCRCGVGLAR